jgi:hypothetical protein
MSHLFRAISGGKVVDLSRLAACGKECGVPAPSLKVWRQLDAALGGTFSLNQEDLMEWKAQMPYAQLMPVDFVTAFNAKDRTDEEKARVRVWQGHVRWWSVLVRAGYKLPAQSAAPPGKRPRVAL